MNAIERAVRAACVLLFAGFAGCSNGPAKPPAPAAHEAPSPLHRSASLVVGTASAGGLPGAPSASPFRPGDNGFDVVLPSYVAHVGSDGSLAFRAHPVDNPLRLSTGGSLGLTMTNALVDRDAVAIERGAVHERFQATPYGVEQSYVFDHAPSDAKAGVHLEVVVEGGQLVRSEPTRLLFRVPGSPALIRYGAATWVDARGVETPVTMSFADGVVHLDVDAATVARSVFPATLDPLVGSDVLSPGSAANSWTLTPGLGTNGTETLVTWTEFTDGTFASGTLYGALVTANTSGATPEAVLSSGPFPIAPLTSSVHGMSVDSDGTDFLVVWAQNDGATGFNVLGKRVTSAAVVDATPLAISNATGDQTLPSVVFDGSEYFIVWTDSRYSGGQLPYARVTKGTPTLFMFDQPSTTGVSLPAGTVGFALQVASKRDGHVLLASEVSTGTSVSLLSSLSNQNAAPSVATSTTALGGLAYLDAAIWDGTQYVVLGGSLDSIGDQLGIALVVSATGAVLSDYSLPPFGYTDSCPGPNTAYQPFFVVGTGDPHADLYFGSANAGFNGAAAVVRAQDASIAAEVTLGFIDGGGDIAAVSLSPGVIVAAYEGESGGYGDLEVQVNVITTTGAKTGSSCTQASDCLSASCVDNYCCEAACSSPCQSCGGATAGSCTPLALNANPSGCALPHACDGVGSCKLVNGQTCQSSSASDCITGQCADGYCCDTACSDNCDFCDFSGHLGSCTIAPAGTDGAPACTDLLCNGTSASCPAGCSDDTECAPGTYCGSSATCVPQIASGASCNPTVNCEAAGCRECADGPCVGGICCSGACSGACAICGVGTGSCSAAPAGSEGSPDCAPYTCSGTSNSCTTTCTSDAQCASSAVCNVGSGTCTGTAPNGAACAHSDACASRFCVDGVCCNAACGGQCQACDVTTSVGTCSPVDGAPHGSRPACNGSDAGDDAGLSCSARVCQGETNVSSCVGYVGSTVECVAPSCSGGAETAAATCDGMGSCSKAVVHECAPYACGTTQCKTTCASSADCATGNSCDTATGMCAPGSTCVSTTSVQSAAGVETSCAPYLCEGSACLTSCSSSADCAEGSACDATGHCVQAPSGGASSSSGGGCSMSGPRRTSPPVWPIGTLLGVAGWARWRRRSGS